MKKELTALIISIFLLSFYVGHIRYNEYDTLDQFSIHTNLVNRQGTMDLENLRVTALLPELGIYIPSNSVNLDAGETMATFNFFENYNIPKGEHLVRVCATNDNLKSCKYRYISFI